MSYRGLSDVMLFSHMPPVENIVKVVFNPFDKKVVIVTNDAVIHCEIMKTENRLD